MRYVVAGTSNPSRPSLRDSSNLDFVRSVAVLAVFLDHVLETLGKFHGFDPRPFAWYSGRIGVLIFFVLTSLVLLQSLERSARSGKASTLGFYVRRGFRIYPLSIVCVLGVMAVGMPRTAWDSIYDPPGAGELFANLTLTQNLFYARSVLSVLWSLPFELQMYLFLPAVFWCVDGERGVRNALGLWLLGVAAAIVQPWLVGGGRLSIAEFSPCFLAGAVAYALSRTQQPRLPFLALPLALVGVLGAYCGIASISTEVHPPWLGWALCLALGAVLPFVVELRSPWLRRTCHEIAKYSYGIYLFHMVALWVGLNRFRDEPSVLQLAVVLAMFVALPILGHHLVEKPGIDAGALVAKRLASRLEGAQRPTRSSA